MLRPHMQHSEHAAFTCIVHILPLDSTQGQTPNCQLQYAPKLLVNYLANNKRQGYDIITVIINLHRSASC